MARTILIVEDDIQVRALIQDCLGAAGHRVIATDSIASGWHLFATEKPELCIIDLNLPDGTGLELCEKIRKHKGGRSTPVIILTAQADMESKIAGFTTGADQYLVKPLLPSELILWVDALLRRLSQDEECEPLLRARDCEIDVPAHIVRYKGAEISNLTGKEFDLLYYIMKRRPKVLSRKQILVGLWRTITVDHVVDTHLTNLRKKLPRELADKIQTLPGKGFRYLE